MPNEFRTFPQNRADALAMLYTRAQDLTGKTPEEVCAIYDDARRRMDAELTRLDRERGSRNPR